MIKLSKIIQELSKTGAMSGAQEKQLNIGLRKIHMKQADFRRTNPTPQTPHSKINYGGCGIFAKLLYYNLRKFLNITPEIIVFTMWHKLPKGEINNIKSLKDLNNQGYYLMHIVLKIKDYYIDSSGIHKKSWFDKIYGMDLKECEGMTIQTLTKWVATGKDWNDTFDRYTTGNINKDIEHLLFKIKNQVKK